MSLLIVDAACAAEARAKRCRLRIVELAARRRVEMADVVRARAAAERATERAALADQRLEQTRRRLREQHGRCARSATRRPVPLSSVRKWEPAELRERAGLIATETLFECYLSVGGHCSAFELDAFLHAAIELPTDELTILGHAVWELTEFDDPR
jgi:hypothetical protein